MALLCFKVRRLLNVRDQEAWGKLSAQSREGQQLAPLLAPTSVARGRFDGWKLEGDGVGVNQ